MATESAGNALISVANKDGIVEFTAGLAALNDDEVIYASGGTFDRISENGVPAADVAELTGGSAILGHRVVTLSREVGAGLLADLESPEDLAEMQEHGYPIIGLVCQDSYPLEAEIHKSNATPKSVIAQWDIGGPTMLMEASKGNRIVLSVAEQRQQVLDWLRAGRPDEAEFKAQLIQRAVYEVVRYNSHIAKYLGGDEVSIHVARKISNTKYGENPQAAEAALYADNRVDVDPLGIDQFEHAQGFELSCVNITDMDRLLQTSTHIAAGFERNFGEVPKMAIGVKHGNACGAAVGETFEEAVAKMLDGDQRAIFGGVVIINGEIDESIAKVLMTHGKPEGDKQMFDGILCASITEEAAAIIDRKKTRVEVNPALANLSAASLDTSRRLRPVRGAYLEQPNYDFVQDLSAGHMEFTGDLTEQQKRDMILAWAIGSTSNSNTITLVKDGMLIGNGVGQQDRVGAAELALWRTSIETASVERVGDKVVITKTLDASKLEGAVAYSDSFFPYPDAPALLIAAGVKAILTSSGSQIGDGPFKELVAETGISAAMVPDKIGRGFANH